MTFIEALPEGMATRVGERGLKHVWVVSASGWAWRGRCLADPRVLILDEATSALDNETQREVAESTTAALHGDTTMIVVAHRLSTVRH